MDDIKLTVVPYKVIGCVAVCLPVQTDFEIDFCFSLLQGGSKFAICIFSKENKTYQTDKTATICYKKMKMATDKELKADI